MEEGNDDWDPLWAMDLHTAASVGDTDLLVAEAAKGVNYDATNASKWASRQSAQTPRTIVI
jgi:hypothetical protein